MSKKFIKTNGNGLSFMAAPKKVWHIEDIKAEVRKRGATMSEVALNAGLYPNQLSQCLRFPSPRSNQAIAEFLGLTVHDLWPQWFDADGQRRPGLIKPSDSQRARHRQKDAAA